MAGSLALTACGGGSGSSASSNANLSDSQKAYESFVLAQNGGQHYVYSQLQFVTSGTGAVSVNPSSYFFTEDSSLAQSPALAGPQTETIGRTSLSANLSAPAASTGQRYLINGAVVVAAVPTINQISYSGANVQESYFAQDGKTVVETLLGTSYSTVSLSGAISASPAELFSGSGLSVLTDTVNGTSFYNKSATWQTGAAYMKVVRQFAADMVEAGDCVAPATTGVNLTPCATTATTLEGFFPHASPDDNVTYNLSDGQIVTLAGVRAWVATAARSGPTTSYRVYYQNNGQIFSGILIRNGTPSQVNSGTNTPQNFYVFLNRAAAQSIASALTF